MSTVVPVGVVSISIESLMALISTRPRPLLPGLTAGGFQEPESVIRARISSPTTSTSVSIDPTLCPRYACSTQFVHASLTDQHDVAGLCGRDASRS